ncbi:MAG: hypothetical protein R3F65_23050 [bacterium]
MKKLLIALVAAALVAAIVWFALRGGAARLAVADVLSARHTASVTGARALDALARRWLPLATLAPDGEALQDPATRVQKLGFDPATPEGWRSIGIDPAAGAALVVDARLARDGREPPPIALLAVNDRTALLAWISKTSGKPATIEGAPPIETLVIDETRVPIGRIGDYTAFSFARGEEIDTTRDAFAAFLTADGERLADAEPWRDAFAAADDADLLLYAYADASALGGLTATVSQQIGTTAIIDFYARLFPAALAWSGEDGGGLRLLATEAGVALVRKLAVPQRRAPAFARYLPPTGWSALRISLNLPELLDGVGAAVPPAASDVRKVLTMVPIMLPLAAGISLDDITAAFSGHAVFAAATTALDKPALGADMLALIAVADGDRADALIGKLADQLVKKAPGAAVTPVTVAGHAGRQIAIGDVMTTAVRVDDVLIVGPAAVVEAALGLDRHLEGDGADALDGDVIAGAWLDLGPVLPQADPQLDRLLAHPRLAPLEATPRAAWTLTLDRGGLLATAQAPVPIDELVAALGAAMFWEARAVRVEGLEGIDAAPMPSDAIPAEAMPSPDAMPTPDAMPSSDAMPTPDAP